MVTVQAIAFAGLIGCNGGNAAPPSPNVAGSSSAGVGGGTAGTTDMTIGGQLVGAGAGGGLVSAGTAGMFGAGTGGLAGVAAGSGGAGGGASVGYPSATDVLEVLTRVNAQFAQKWPDPGAPIVVGSSRPSNIWTRAVYYEGLLALYAVEPQPAYLSYAVAWGEAHSWQLRNDDSSTTNADNQCAGQTYIDLYQLDGAEDAKRITAIQTSIDGMVKNHVTDAWTWVDAIQMSMPVFARLGAMNPNGGYFDAMYASIRIPSAQPRRACTTSRTTCGGATPAGSRKKHRAANQCTGRAATVGCLPR